MAPNWLLAVGILGEGDRWVCEYCAREEADMLKSEGWEYIFDRNEQDLICSICHNPEFTPED